MSEFLTNPSTRLLVVVSLAVIVVVIAVYIANRSDSSDNCKSDSDCNSSNAPVCHEQKCVQCAFNSDCPGTSTCNQNQCTVVTSSEETFTCSGCPAIPSVLNADSPPGNGGFSIAYNPVDGLLYRVSGGFDAFSVETFDPNATDGVSTLVHDAVDISAIFGSTDKITAFVYETSSDQWIVGTNGGFIGRLNADFISTSGVVGVLFESITFRSISYILDGTLIGTSSEGDVDFYIIDLVGETETPVTLTNTDWTLNEIWGASFDPVSELLYFNCSAEQVSTTNEFLGIAIVDIAGETFSPTCASSGGSLDFNLVYADLCFAPTGILFLQQGNDVSGNLHRLPSAPCAGSFVDDLSLVMNARKNDKKQPQVQGPRNKNISQNENVHVATVSAPKIVSAPKVRKIRMRSRNKRK
tara:strand:+ start:30301 stop:31533 length:1233 start_codon:yes stop_codon:yes gene_type:complete